MWWAWFPGQVRDASALPPHPAPILRPDLAYTLMGPAAAGTAGAAQPRQVGRGEGQHCDRCYVGPVLLGHLQDERASAPRVSSSTAGTGPQPHKVPPAPTWQRRHLLYPASLSRPQARFAQATYLPEVSSPVEWHGPEDCELKGKGGGRSGTVLGRKAGGTSLPSQITSPGPANRWRTGGPQGSDTH